MNVILILGAEILDTFNLLSFFKFLVIEFLFTHHDLIALKIFDSEPNSTEFDSVKFLNLVIVLSGFIFERPCYKPESVNAFLFLSGSCSSMVEVVTLSVFLEETEAAGVWVLSLINNIVGLVKIYLIIITYYLTLRLCLQAHFDNVS